MKFNIEIGILVVGPMSFIRCTDNKKKFQFHPNSLVSPKIKHDIKLNSINPQT